MKKRKGLLITLLVIIALVLIASIIFIYLSLGSSKDNQLDRDVCVYDHQKYITCGAAFILVSEGIEYPLVANERFYFPQGEDKLIGVVDNTKPEGKRGFMLYLKEGEHTINEETSKKAVGSFLVD